MSRPEAVHDLRVVLGTLIGVANEHTDGCAGGFALENTGENLHLVRLPPLGGMARGTGFTPIQIVLQIAG